MAEVRIPALAKINLRLEVIGKRADGYHELRTIFQTISLQDEIRLKSARQPGITLKVLGNDPLSNEPLERNLVYRAVASLRQVLKLADGVAIELHKVIPAGRGLGGGSSDAAAALIGYLRLAKKQLPRERLFELAEVDELWASAKVTKFTRCPTFASFPCSWFRPNRFKFPRRMPTVG